MTSSANEPLDLLGRKLKVGDHVVYGTMGYGHSYNILHGVICEIKTLGRVKIEPMEAGRKMVTRNCRQVCHIVLPDIQDPEVQLGGGA